MLWGLRQKKELGRQRGAWLEPKFLNGAEAGHLLWPGSLFLRQLSLLKRPFQEGQAAVAPGQGWR